MDEKPKKLRIHLTKIKKKRGLNFCLHARHTTIKLNERDDISGKLK
jgi:hypothetical protein